jgi:hypothetical protein
LLEQHRLLHQQWQKPQQLLMKFLAQHIQQFRWRAVVKVNNQLEEFLTRLTIWFPIFCKDSASDRIIWVPSTLCYLFILTIL